VREDFPIGWAEIDEAVDSHYSDSGSIVLLLHVICTLLIARHM
jgi:hypothetical protein